MRGHASTTHWFAVNRNDTAATRRAHDLPGAPRHIADALQILESVSDIVVRSLAEQAASGERIANGRGRIGGARAGGQSG